VFGNVDRDGDRIVKGAFAKTIDAWQDTGRTVPLHWNHSADPDDVIGYVDPRSMVETDRGLVVGQLDLENSERARQAWRAMKTAASACPSAISRRGSARPATGRTSCSPSIYSSFEC
jgi:HK97 family phage prohead protease